MLRSIPGRLFLEWRAYEELEPWDEVRADLRSAQIVQIVRAFAGEKNVKLADCLLPFGEEPEPPKPKTWQDIKAITQLWADASKPEPRSGPEPTKRMKRRGRP